MLVCSTNQVRELHPAGYAGCNPVIAPDSQGGLSIGLFFGVTTLFAFLLIAGYGTRRWLSGLLWLGPTLALIAVTTATVGWIRFPTYHAAFAIAYLGTGLFLATWGVGGFVDARKSDEPGPVGNWPVSLVVILLGAALAFVGLGLLAIQFPFYTYD